MTKPFVLGVDLDGVCADYFNGFRQYVRQARDEKSLRPAPIAYDFTSDPAWSDVVPNRDVFLQWHRSAVLDGLFAELRPIDGVSEALWRLSDLGVYIRIITHRLHNKGDYGRAASDTIAWLDVHNIPYRGISFERFKTDVGADLYIDDSPTNVRELRSAGKRAIVFDAPYNQDVKGERVHNWNQVVETVELALELHATA